jgi:hypothetical protein
MFSNKKNYSKQIIIQKQIIIRVGQNDSCFVNKYACCKKRNFSEKPTTAYGWTSCVDNKIVNGVVKPNVIYLNNICTFK